ncbi:MAG: ThuA domain-containing protein [Clostridia bacterium]|nr:ThuA domain-containing protein [Clostridia bacterium]
MKKILVLSKGTAHPSVFCRMKLRKILMETGEGFEYMFSNDLKMIDGCIGEYDAVVLFFHKKKTGKTRVDSLMNYVRDGGKLLCIHGALASFKDSRGYSMLTGAAFTGHDRIREMKIEGKTRFSIIDELYEFDISDDCEVKLTCDGHPVYWLNRYGNGTVACLSPGHRSGTFENPGFREVIKTAVAADLWVTEDKNAQS